MTADNDIMTAMKNCAVGPTVVVTGLEDYWKLCNFLIIEIFSTSSIDVLNSEQLPLINFSQIFAPCCKQYTFISAAGHAVWVPAVGLYKCYQISPILAVNYGTFRCSIRRDGDVWTACQGRRPLEGKVKEKKPKVSTIQNYIFTQCTHKMIALICVKNASETTYIRKQLSLHAEQLRHRPALSKRNQSTVLSTAIGVNSSSNCSCDIRSWICA